MRRDDYLAGLLLVLREGLTPVVDDLLASNASQEQLGELAVSLEHIAEELRTVYLAGELDAVQIDTVNDHVLPLR
jgi:hypothetical protein